MRQVLAKGSQENTPGRMEVLAQQVIKSTDSGIRLSGFKLGLFDSLVV